MNVGAIGQAAMLETMQWLPNPYTLLPPCPWVQTFFVLQASQEFWVYLIILYSFGIAFVEFEKTALNFALAGQHSEPLSKIIVKLAPLFDLLRQADVFFFKLWLLRFLVNERLTEENHLKRPYSFCGYKIGSGAIGELFFERFDFNG